jgi:hypothetical protein
MKQSENDPVGKRFYEAPKIAAINLRPEEAVLGNCKISGGTGPNPGGTCVSLGPCHTIGS